RDRKIYMASPDYMAAYARRLIDAGARFVGGCCGTTPEHVRRIRDVVATVQPVHARPHAGPAAARVASAATVAQDAPQAVAPLAERSELGAALASARFL